MTRRLAIFAMVVALGGCTTVTDVSNPFNSAAIWGADSNSEGDRLWFGIPDSDNIDLMLTCHRHTGRVEVYTAAGIERPTVIITFESGASKSHHFMKRLESDDGYGGFIGADDAAFAAFAQTGEIATSAAGKRFRFPPAKAMAAAFFKACR